MGGKEDRLQLAGMHACMHEKLISEYHSDEYRQSLAFGPSIRFSIMLQYILCRIDPKVDEKVILWVRIYIFNG